MREFMSITKALADANRVPMGLVLRKGELCACQLTELFGLAPWRCSSRCRRPWPKAWKR
ncbi:MAG TPA: hypothetical protein PKM43_03425 [Verrucomicrobiota bacterium]|nr:hypothetical protein [Verrucomicrobiota bacterium]HRZ35178.1 hypothetical protein [Candidatus Paceibacterota bacterium]HRZ55586.1 hypothetical protein [Candidatus Paceibacterota bacterium]